MAVAVALAVAVVDGVAGALAVAVVDGLADGVADEATAVRVLAGTWPAWPGPLAELGSRSATAAARRAGTAWASTG